MLPARRAAAAACAAVAAVAGIALHPAPAQATVVVKARLSATTLFGAAAPTVDDLNTVEKAMGHRFGVHRDFHGTVFENLIGPKELDDAAKGRVSVSSFKAPWNDVKSGKLDSVLRQRAREVASFNHPIYLTYFHEPEDDGARLQSSAADYKAAYRRVVAIFRANGATNVRWVWTLMAQSFANGVASQWYPGDDVVDVVGADAYNWAYSASQPKAGWRTLAEIAGPAHQFAVAKGKGFAVPEMGCIEDPHTAGRRGQWLSDAYSTLQSWKAEFASYFDVVVANNQWPVPIASSTFRTWSTLG